MKLWKLLGLGSLLALASCGGGGSTGGGGTSGPNTIAGLVTDIGSGARLNGVAVSVVGGTQNTTTDAKGEFILTGLAKGTVNLTLSKANYAPGYATADSTDSARTVLVALKKEGALQSYNPTQARTIFQRTEAGPYAVIFTPGSLDTSDTNLKVSVTPLDPTKEDAALPGDLVASGGTPLGAVTFAEFSILDSSGKRVNLKAGSSATVELPIPAELRSQYPLGSKIHCYAYNPQTGKWEDFVEGTVEVSSVDGSTPVLKASIRHFSWYGGAPAVQDQDCAAVAIVSKVTGKPLAGATVTARPGLKATTDELGITRVTVQRGARVKFFASKTYTDTYVDDKGNLIPKKGAKVIEIGKLDEELGPLTSRGPCAGSGLQGVHGAVKGDPGNPIVINTGLAPGFTYQATAILASGSSGVFLSLEQGIPNENGELDNPQPASGAKIKLSDASGQSVDLSELSPNSGQYGALGSSFPIQAGKLYTLSIDADGNGTIDGSGSCYAIGTVAWTTPANGGSYASATLNASWTDSASSSPGYNGLYYAILSASDASDLATYVGSARSFQPKSALSDPTNPQPLKAGAYTGTLFVFSGAFTGTGSNNFTVTDNITGIGVQGQFYSFASAPSVNFTLTAP